VNCWESCYLQGECFIPLLQVVIQTVRVLEVARDMTIAHHTGRDMTIAHHTGRDLTIAHHTGRLLERCLCIDADTLCCGLS